jgi:hypothetical protein
MDNARKESPLMENQRIKVKLIGKDGNAFFILGTVRKALVKAGKDREAEEFIKKATSGNYDNLLGVVMEYVDVE